MIYDAAQHDNILKMHTQRQRAELQAHQDQAVREGRAPWCTNPASTLYTQGPTPKTPNPRVKASDLGLALASLPPRLWGAPQDPEDAQAEREDPDPDKLAASDAAWERAKLQEVNCYLCQPDDEPEGGAERRTPPPREIRLGAELQGGEVSVSVPSDSTDADHLVTCKRVHGHGVVLYAATSCTCEDFIYRKSKTARQTWQLPSPCKHMKRAERFAREQTLQKLMDEKCHTTSNTTTKAGK